MSVKTTIVIRAPKNVWKRDQYGRGIMFRIKTSIISIFVFVIILSGSNELSAFDYVINDFTFHSIPNISRLLKGVPFKDPVFHTEIIRITDAPTDVKGAKYNYAQPGYPKHDIENADGTKLLIQSFANPCWHVWNANPPYNKISNIVYYPGSSGQAIDFRWDAIDPNVGYFEYQGKFWKYDIVSNKATVLHDFKEDFPDPAFALCTMQEEGSSSDDSRYWAFIMKYYDANHSPTWWNHAYVVYDKDFFRKDNGKIISILLEGDSIFRDCGDISMSPSGNYVVLGNTHFIYPRDFSSIRTGSLTGGHSDLAYSKEGREVMFGFKYRGSTLGGYWAAMEDIVTGEVTWLTPIQLVPSYHFSGNAHDKPGWGLISTYLPAYPDSETKWGQHEVYMVELTKRTDPPPRVWRLAHTHTVRKDYADAPFAKINKKGTKVWFGSGWGKAWSDSGNQYDVYQINLPSTWYKDLMGNMPPTASISATPLSGKPPLTVNFTGSRKDIDGTVVSYTWNFGDGGTSNQQSVSHTYESPGSYTATFKVTDDKGATGNANVTINVLKSDTTPPAPPKGLKIVK
jgi:hypothetical protein